MTESISENTSQSTPYTPSGYVCRGDLFADLSAAYNTYWRLLVAANLLALIPLGIAILVLWLPYQFYAALGTPLALFASPDWPQLVYWALGVVVIAGSLVAHEGLHGVALKLAGHRPIFGFSEGYPYATVQQGEFLTRRHYLIMALSPLTVMTICGSILLLLLPANVGQIILIALLLNAAASLGDLAVADRVRRWPADTLFAADNEGIKVFVPENIEPQRHREHRDLS
jgi:hypothetical protein